MYWPSGGPQVFAGPVKPNHSNPQNGEEASQTSETPAAHSNVLVDLCSSRNGQFFATATETTLSIWQTFPTILLCQAHRSESSLQNYGPNQSVLLRPDASIAAVRTAQGLLITYHVSVDPATRVLRQIPSDDKAKRGSEMGRFNAEQARQGQDEVQIRYRVGIKIDAGISFALALEDELVVATKKPAAVQCIRWETENGESQHSTELLSHLPWMQRKEGVTVTGIVYDRGMSLYIWIASDGTAFAVQKLLEPQPNNERQPRYFRGHQLHAPSNTESRALTAAINARFSLLAVGCESGNICIYAARDYAGSLPLSHTLIPPFSRTTTGVLHSVKFSPDGYCLFVGYEKGWIMWSVYGKLGGSSFSADRAISETNDEAWLLGVKNAEWADGGARILLLGLQDTRIWALQVARSAMTGCLGPANTSRMLLLTDSDIRIYRGHDASDIMSCATDPSQWNHVQIPSTFLARQRPLRSTVISSDGRYVAVAGRRGLAHYSISSGRWKTFGDLRAENSFVIRGGMCWYQHILIAAVETSNSYEIRLYSREKSLEDSDIVFVEHLPSPVIVMTPSGEDSLLVYTQDNTLYHFIVYPVGKSLQIVQVGQIGLHGIIRAPARVRSITWYIPEHQMIDGDPSQDVVHATVLFLVDAKLVLLQPSKDDQGKLKYDMKVIASGVEFFSFMRDHNLPRSTPSAPGQTPGHERIIGDGGTTAGNLGDSLWFFDGHNVQCWPEFEELLGSPGSEDSLEVPVPISVPIDFYPLAIILEKAVIIGLEPELFQRRAQALAHFRFFIRTNLFLPSILRHYISASDTTTALALCHHYHDLPYFSHALEVLLHTVLDEAVDDSSRTNLLASVISFLSSFPDYLDIIVQCTRKTELRSWKTLFAHLPAPKELFNESLRQNMLKTAGSYLIVLHTLNEKSSESDQAISLLRRAKAAQDWDLCKELARFLMALDPSGELLQEAMEGMDRELPTPTAVVSLDETLTTPITPRQKSAFDHLTISNGNRSGRSSPGDSSDSHSRYEPATEYFPEQ